MLKFKRASNLLTKSFWFGIVATDDVWYTPEEFKAKWKLLVTDYNLNRFVARSPEFGIAESLENLRRALARAEKCKKIAGVL